MASRGWGVLALVLLTGCATGVPVGFRMAAGALRYQPRVGAFPGRAAMASPSPTGGPALPNPPACGGQEVPPG